MLKSAIKSIVNKFGYRIIRKDRPVGQGAQGPSPSEANLLQQLSETQRALKHLQQLQHNVDELTREVTLSDPPVRKRLKDNPELFPRIRAEIEKRKLPADVAGMLLNPEFSIEDRKLYRELPQRRDFENWDGIAAVISMIIETQYIKYRPRYHDQAKVKQHVDTLRREGYVPLEPMLDQRQIREIQEYFLKCPVLNGHIPLSARHRGIERYLNHTAEDYPLACHTMNDMVRAPHLLEMSLSPFILDMAAEYFGCAPLLTWLQSWWNFKGLGDYPNRQMIYHRDSNDFRMFWVYLYLTDVDEGAGPHSLIRRSGNLDTSAEGMARLDHVKGATDPNVAMEEAFAGLVEVVKGPAGTMFLSRGVDFHRVITPLVRKRQIFAARFCMNDYTDVSANRDGDRVPGRFVAERVGDDEQLRHVTKMCFDWNERPSE